MQIMTKHLTLIGLIALMVSAGGFVRAQTPQPAPIPGSSAPPAQQPPLTFRAEVNYVEVDARVLDKDGKFITDLKPADFQVFEDGKAQKITAFSLVNIPVERAARPLFASQPIEPDVRTNLEGADGRIYLTPTRHAGEYVIRVQVGQFDCTRDDVMAIPAVVADLM